MHKRAVTTVVAAAFAAVAGCGPDAGVAAATMAPGPAGQPVGSTTPVCPPVLRSHGTEGTRDLDFVWEPYAAGGAQLELYGQLAGILGFIVGPPVRVWLV